MATELEQRYLQILEKTNQQLSLWSNPYALMVGALGVLFTVAAIVVGFVLFRQSRDYRELVNKSIADYQAILTAFIDDKNQQIELLKAGLTSHITTLSEDLKSASGKQKQQIESKIAELERLRTTLKPQEAPKPSLAPVSGLGFSAASRGLAALGALALSHICSRCATSFPVPSGLLSTLSTGGRTARCPNCGQIDTIS